MLGMAQIWTIFKSKFRGKLFLSILLVIFTAIIITLWPSLYSRYIQPSEFAPLLFEFRDAVPLESIYIGNEKINPNSQKFYLSLQDRHGMAWADYNRDNKIDIFITRGSLRENIQQITELLKDKYLAVNLTNQNHQVIQNMNDELWTNNGSNSFDNDTNQSGIAKNNCAGRQVAWVDFNNDDHLDLYRQCKTPPGKVSAGNQLYLQKADGKFINVASESGLDIPDDEGGRFVWVDFDNDGDLDFFWAPMNKEYRLYVNSYGQFNEQIVASKLLDLKSTRQIINLASADYDMDGDIDIFVTSRQGNSLLVNESGQYREINPIQIGLSDKGGTANWVDYDNDGLLDLHLFPGKLFHQLPNHKFKSTNLLLEFDKIGDGRCTWFDANNDGARDILMAVKTSPFKVNLVKFFASKSWKFKNWHSRKFPEYFFREDRYWKLSLYNNIGSQNHRIQVKLIGSPGNHQAIGAKVIVVTPDGQHLEQVGYAEGSIFSQGHYRLYFGLGKYERPESVKIIWPDGKTQELKNPPGDWLLVVKREIA